MNDPIGEFDYHLLLLINGSNTSFLDAVMLFLSSIAVWIPLYVLIISALFFPRLYAPATALNTRIHHLPEEDRYQKNKLLHMLVLGGTGLLCVAVCFGLTDQISCLIKDLVQRPRPGHNLLLSPELHLPDGKGGLYGFVSSHAANTFGLALLTSLIFRRKAYTFFMMLWAFLISYSRIYLGRHFPADVVCGALLGLLIAAVFYQLWKFLIKHQFKYLEKNDQSHRQDHRSLL